MTPKNVIVSNIFGDANRGGAAITAQAIAAARQAYPECVVTGIVVRDEKPELTHRHTIRRFPEIELLPPPFVASGHRLGGLMAALRSLAAIALPRSGRNNVVLEQLRQAELVISKGGYVFVQRRGFKDLLSLWLSAFPVTFAARRGVPTVVHATSIGPFDSWSSRILCGYILRRASLVLPRDPMSFDCCRQLGIHPNRLEEVPDSVFALDPPPGHVVEEVARRLGLHDVSFAAFTVQRGPGKDEIEERFLRNLEELARNLLDSGVVERLVLAIQVDGDLVSTEKFVRRMADPRVSVMRDDLSVEDMIAFYANAACTVGTRLHSTIFSLLSGTPAFPISMSGVKSVGVFRSIGLGEWVLPYPDFSPADASKSIHEVLRSSGAGRDRVGAAVAPAREAAARIPELIRERLPLPTIERVPGG
jgi:polysaccharide pyruvyl transferase WcaK-like protein